MKSSDKLYKRYNKLKNEIVEKIKTHLTKKRFVFNDAFTDEANNDLQAINKDEVFFNCDDNGNGGDSYPLHELGITDALFILGVLEDK